MQFIVTARDGAGMLERRLAVRPRHLENLQKIKGTVLCAGGLLDEAGRMKGSVLVLDMESREALDEYLAGEPYMTEKVWEKIDVERMNVVILKGKTDA